MGNARGVIGIVSGIEPDTGWYGCKRAYIEAISRAGGLPVIVPYSLADDVAQILEVTNGVLLTGGEDAIDPVRFGARLHPRVKWINGERDEFEIRLVNAAVEMDRPLLAICRGMQVLNVALGGSLCQHLRDERTDVLEHHHRASLSESVHQLDIVPDTKLSEIAAPTLRRSVNSSHYQGVDAPGETVIVSAVAPDGTIEAVEVKGCRFAIGVQWHPEELVGRDSFSDDLFAEFVRACQPALGAPAPFQR